MAHSNVTGATATMLCTKLHSFEIKLSLPNARYQKNEKGIQISVDDKVEWSYKWTKMFAPPLGQELLVPLSSTVQISLIGKHHTLHHLLGSYSGRVIDFLLEQDKPLTLQDDHCGACAMITVGLSPVVDYQEALNASVDASLARLGNDQRLVGGLNNMDQASSSVQIMYCAVETHGQYIAPLGQVLQLMKKLIDNVAEVGISSFLGLKSSSDSTQAHPLLKLGWTLLSSAVQEHRLNDSNVQGLAESLRELVGVAEVALLIDEYTKHSFMVRLGKMQITDVTMRITKCQVELKDLYEKFRTRITAYTVKCVKEMHDDAKRSDAQKLSNEIRRWLKAHNSSMNHKSARDTCVEGTGLWFTEDERFWKWLDEPGRMWITGGHEYSPGCAIQMVLRSIHKAGFGKTVLFSTCVEVVRRHAFAQGVTCCCAYSYFDARESGGASRKFETLVRSILDQLCFNRADITNDRGDEKEIESAGFRLVAFWIDELKYCHSLKAVRDKLEHLPTSLNAMYTSMVSKITGDDLQYAQAIIPWLLFSVKRLDLEEIATVMCFGFSSGRPHQQVDNFSGST
ncbi:hypothetical protein PAXINDRAFT_16596 [Paxillus involutus ATCC 200175]|uniref:Nephrocystin 3-like N-terminal domain-containing protein n=1 Tax=Paxillus involutus ATCC 200175 TaxID=664439 RepID=A0A0C9T3Z8_PAXIN|nr:hypothetical protein PAXINDRAFT_16596 [Paxillus involutus ATCC 200175]